jgi:undecaprenyl-diphosphatase
MLRHVLSFDEMLLLRARRLEAPMLTPLMRTFTTLGNPASWTLFGIALAFAGPKGPRLSRALATAGVIASLTSLGLKRLFGRPRPSTIPNFFALAEDPDAFSFPSGHTAAAVAIAISVGAENPKLGLGLVGLAVGIAASRVYLGAHYPLDVAAGAVLGAGAGAATRVLLR